MVICSASVPSPLIQIYLVTTDKPYLLEIQECEQNATSKKMQPKLSGFILSVNFLSVEIVWYVIMTVGILETKN